MIGDPGGKDEERVLLSSEQVRQNAEYVRQQLRGYLDFEGPNAAIMVNNLDWLGEMTLIEYLRDIGKHFSVNAMLAKESVRNRLENREQGISYTEFSYMILQSVDYLHLYDTFGCTVQIGGQDQWGNITAGGGVVRPGRGGRVTGRAAPPPPHNTRQKLAQNEGGAPRPRTEL